MSITWSPAAPQPGDEVTIAVRGLVGGTTIDLSASEVTFVSVPTGSEIETGLLLDQDEAPTLVFTPDVEGEYEISVQAFVINSIPAAFAEDGAASESKVLVTGDSSVQTATISVGSSMDMPLRTLNGHGVTLRLAVHGDVVTAAELVLPTTDKARACTLDSSVLADVGALVGETASTLGADLPGAVSAIAAAFNAHRTQGGVHSPADDLTNVYDEDPPIDMASAVERLNILRPRIVAHLLDSSTAPGRWHPEDDTKNVLLSPPASSLASATQLCADLSYRVYDRHRLEDTAPNSHATADSTNDLAAPDLFTLSLVTILDFLADETPAIPAGESEGPIALASRLGFTRTTTV